VEGWGFYTIRRRPPAEYRNTISYCFSVNKFALSVYSYYSLRMLKRNCRPSNPKVNKHGWTLQIPSHVWHQPRHVGYSSAFSKHIVCHKPQVIPCSNYRAAMDNSKMPITNVLSRQNFHFTVIGPPPPYYSTLSPIEPQEPAGASHWVLPID
jgi:hypothetical protein